MLLQAERARSLSELARGTTPVSTGDDRGSAHADQIRDWLFAILRFAVTRQPSDKFAALTIASLMDRSGSPTGFTYFSRTTAELCEAIADEASPRRAITLRRHHQRIEDEGLRRAFEAAVDLQSIAEATRKRKTSLDGLWKGLRQR